MTADLCTMLQVPFFFCYSKFSSSIGDTTFEHIMSSEPALGEFNEHDGWTECL
jgi:hypothetical protein